MRSVRVILSLAIVAAPCWSAASSWACTKFVDHQCGTQQNLSACSDPEDDGNGEETCANSFQTRNSMLTWREPVPTQGYEYGYTTVTVDPVGYIVCSQSRPCSGEFTNQQGDMYCLAMAGDTWSTYTSKSAYNQSGTCGGPPY